MENFNQKPVCEMHQLCGGCSLQQLAYKDQLQYKLQLVKEALDFNGVDSGILQEIVPAPEIYAYRNKMEYSFGDEVIGGQLNLGMHKAKSYMSIIDASCCQLVPQDFNTVLAAVRDWCRAKGYAFYNRKRHTGMLRSLLLKQGVRTNQLLVNIITTSNGQDASTRFCEEEFKSLVLGLKLNSTVCGILHTIDDSVADATICDKLNVLYGNPYYEEEIMGLKFKVGAFSFFQSNVPAAERLYKDAVSLIENAEGKVVYDLFCGTGTISQAIAPKCKEVYGVEIVEEAVQAAKESAKLNGLNNCHFIAGDVLKVLDTIDTKPDVIIVDPPRSGIHPKAWSKILSYGVKQIVYVSCGPKSLGANLKACPEYGYKIQSIKAYDNFSFTNHTEVVVLMSRA